VDTFLLTICQQRIDARPTDAERLWAMIETNVYFAAFGGHW
jgi:hypothetical protein